MHINTHRSFLVLKPGVRASQLFIAHHTLTHSPLLQLDIQMSSGLIYPFKPLDIHKHTHIYTNPGKKKERASVDLHVHGNGQPIGIQCAHVYICVSVSMPVRGFRC